MQTSKLFNFALGLLATATLAACNLPSPKDKESTSSSATFTAQAMADKSKALDTYVQGNFALPSSKVFNLQACVKDSAYDKIIAGHDFMIEELNKKVTSDKAGCLTWAERINFNFLAESQYVRIERHIRGLGLHKGTQTVAFAVNPWSHGESLAPVLNPDDGNNIPRLVDDQEQAKLALKGFSADNKITTRPLWVEEGRLFVTEQKLTQKGVDLLVEMRPTVSIQLTKMNGEMFLRPLTAGSFKARLKLIHSYEAEDKEIHRLLTETAWVETKMENGGLAIKSVVTLTAIPTRGQMVLGLELQPVNGPEGLKPFEGIYLLGDYDQIKGSSSLKLSTGVAQTEDFQLSNYVNSTLSDVSRNNITGSVDADIYQKPKIEVAKLEFSFVRMSQEKTNTREVQYNVRACVVSGIDQKKVRSQTFKVTKFRQNDGEPVSTVSVQTDNNSCVSWDERISFKSFEVSTLHPRNGSH